MAGVLGWLVAEFETKSKDFRVGGCVGGEGPGALGPHIKSIVFPFIYSFYQLIYLIIH